MDFKKLFNTQAELDAAIYEKHPEIKGQDNLDWKVLALQVELGELANEWRGFKKWSNDQEPRNHVHAGICSYCYGTGEDDTEEEYFECDACGGEGDEYTNPLLEEYVDCLHFILTIGLELGIEVNKQQIKGTPNKDVTRHFTDLMLGAGTLLFPNSDKTQNYYSLLGEFLMLGIELGFDAEQIEQAYYAKNKINHERQASGY